MAHLEPHLDSLDAGSASRAKCLKCPKSSGRADRLTDPRHAEAGQSVRQSASGATTFSWMQGRPPELWTAAPEKGRASPYAINRCDYADLPNRLPCLASAPARASRKGTDHPDLTHGATVQPCRTDPPGSRRHRAARASRAGSWRFSATCKQGEEHGQNDHDRG